MTVCLETDIKDILSTSIALKTVIEDTFYDCFEENQF